MKTNSEPLPLLDSSKVRPILDQVSLLGGLSEQQLECIFRELRCMCCKQGEMIFRQNELPSYIYIVLKGYVKIYCTFENTTLELLELGTGQCFGETSLIGIQPHSASAVAMEDCELIILSRDALLKLFDEDKELYSILLLNIARDTSRHLRDARQSFMQYALAHPEKTG